MSNRPILFLDNDFLINVWGNNVGNTDRFNSIMDGIAKNYDIQITSTVFAEAASTTYPKDVAVKNWLETNKISPITTSFPPGSSNGERSIIEAMKNRNKN